MSLVSDFKRWLLGPITHDEAEFQEALRELEEVVEVSKHNQDRLIRQIHTDQRASEKSLETAERALRIARKIGATK